MADKKPTPDWFKTKREWRTLLKMMDRLAMGTALDLAIDYMDTLEVPEEVAHLEPLTLAAFNFMKKSIDDAAEECVNISEIRRLAAMKRWHPDKSTEPEE